MDTNYSYQYKRVTAGPSTPELTLRSNASSPPPTPVLIQVRTTHKLKVRCLDTIIAYGKMGGKSITILKKYILSGLFVVVNKVLF